MKRQQDFHLQTAVHRKATHTARILHTNSIHPNVHKMACIRTLFGRIESHCTNADAKRKETQNLHRICQQNGYNRQFIRRCLQPRRQRAAMQQQINRVAVPYIIQGASDAAARILSTHGALGLSGPSFQCYQLRCPSLATLAGPNPTAPAGTLPKQSYPHHHRHVTPPFKATALRSAMYTTACSICRTKPMPRVNSRTIYRWAR